MQPFLRTPCNCILFCPITVTNWTIDVILRELTHSLFVSIISFCFVLYCKWTLKPGFHMIVRIVPIVPVVSKMFIRSGGLYGNATQTIANDPDDWDDLDRLDRVEFYPDDRDDHVNFEAIIWKRSQTTETIGTIEGYPRSHHFYSSNRE